MAIKPSSSGNGRRGVNAQVRSRLDAIEKVLTEINSKLEKSSTTAGGLTEEQVAALAPTFQALEEANAKKPTTFQELLADEISASIVGESYSRWDSTSTYFPTLVFLFVEKKASSPFRRGQVKLRAPISNESLTKLIIEDYKKKIEAIKGVNYTHGSVRCNYVSTDKRFKTTLFAAKVEDARSLFTSLFSVIEEPFDEKNLSITTGRNRTNSTRRLKPLGETELNDTRYNEEFVLHLRKVVLLVNGLRSPILLYKN